MTKMEFDARIVAANQRSDKIMDAVMKNAPTTVDRNMVDRVFRPFIHIMNECEVKSVDPEIVYDTVISMASSMLTEIMVRTVPANNHTVLQEVVQSLMDDLFTQFLKQVSLNFGVTFEQHTSAGAPLNSVQ